MKKNWFAQVCALVLGVLLAVGMFPSFAWAAGTGGHSITVSEYNDNGSVSIASGNTTNIAVGTQVSLTLNVTPDTGYKVDDYSISLGGSGDDYDWESDYEAIPTPTYNCSTHTLTFTMPAFDVDIYTMFRPTDPCTIIYKANYTVPEDYSDESSEWISLDSTSETLSEYGFSRDGYVLIGWNTKADGTGTSYALGQVINPQSDEIRSLVKTETDEFGNTTKSITLYAQWQEGYEVTVDSNSEIYTATANAAVHKAGETVTLTAADGCYFVSTRVYWYTYDEETDNSIEHEIPVTYNSDRTKATFTMPAASVSVYTTVFPENSYLIGYYSNDASEDPGHHEQVVAFGSNTVLDANTFERDGYVFAGWSVYTEDGEQIIADKASTSELDSLVDIPDSEDSYPQLSLDAVWYEEGSYQVTYDANYPEASGYEDETVTQTLLRTDTTVKLKKNEFEIEYSRYSYVFTGWNTKADGTGQAYADEAAVDATLLASVSNPAAGSGEIPGVTLYAQWKQVYGIYFLINDGNGASDYVFDSEHTSYEIDGGGLITMDPIKDAYDGGDTITVTVKPGSRYMLNSFNVNYYYEDEAEEFLAQPIDYTFDATHQKATFTMPDDGQYNVEVSVSIFRNDSYQVYYESNFHNDTALWSDPVGMSRSLKLDEPGTLLTAFVHPYTGSAATPSGYTFAGWNTEPDGSGINFAGGASVTPASFGDCFYDPADDPDAEEGAIPQVTLYAQWTKTSTVERVTMYRLYNPNSGEHFYTASEEERDHLDSVGWNYEGIGWTAPSTSNTPVYRLYSGTDHHYTTSVEERDSLISIGWKDEGIGWYSDDAKGVPLYRQYNPNVNPKAKRNNSGSHNYTTSIEENNHLVSVGWRAEGIGWYGLA